MHKKIKNIYLKLMKKDLTKIEEKVEILTRRSEKMAKKARGDSMAFLFAIFMRDFRSIHVIYIATKARKNMYKSNSRPSRSTWAVINMWIKPRDNEAYILFFVIYMVVTLFVVMCYFSFCHVFLLKLERETAWPSKDNHRFRGSTKGFLLFLYLFLGYPIDRGKSYPFCKSNPSTFLT